MRRSRPWEVLLFALAASAGCGSAEQTDKTSRPGALAGGLNVPVQPATPEPNPANEANLSIAGRWGMFYFEDLVTVDLVQRGTELSGLGCDADLPGGTPDLSSESQYCGPITGEIRGNQAHFSFSFRALTGTDAYKADVTVAADGSRMAGYFNGAARQRFFSTSWLRIPDGESRLAWPAEGEDKPFGATYRLTLVESSSGGTEFDSAQTYTFSYQPNRALGDLGDFWVTEMSYPEAGQPIRIGPVPATDPRLPVSLVLSHDESSITAVAAVTGSGNSYSFGAVSN
jgi:hypothetical protein